MGKRSQKNSSRSFPSASKPENIPFDGKQPQTLETQAFSDLSQKIQARFNKLRQDSPEQNLKQKKRSATMSGEYMAPRPKMRSVTNEAQSRGQKRDSEGAVKRQGQDNVSNGSAETLARTKSVLEKEVYALGGTAEDLALVANLESDSELDDASERNKAFRMTNLEKGLEKGIADILKQVDERGESIPLVSDAEGADDAEEDDEEQNGKEYPSLSPSAGDETASQPLLGKSVLLVAPRPDWFTIQLPAIKIACTSNPKLSPDSVQQLHEHAKSLLHEENEAFKATQRRSSSQKFYSTVIASGTLSDKISALTLAVQESPLHNVKALDTLVNLGKKRSRAQALDVLRALKDLFAQGSLLPGDRKLNAFSTHPSLLGTLANSKSWKRDDPLPGSLQPQHLIVWAYESWLKEEYFEVLKILEIWCNDEIEFSKSKAVHSVYELLKEKPEQESNLLRLLINKLGDPSRKIASQTSYLLMQLMTAHPLMKMTVISSIELDLLFRPGQSLHAKYYAVITLNQTALSGREEDVASKLLFIYFGLFVGLLKPPDSRKRTSNEYSGVRPSRMGQGKSLGKGPNDTENTQAGDLREKLTSAILTGINRAYPYTEPNSQNLPAHLETLFKITHSSNFNTSIQAMILIQQLCSSHQASADRFYRALYESLLDARLVTTSKQSMYLNLLYRALKADTNVKRVKAFAKRILQTLALHQPSFICGCFFLLQELRQTFPGLRALIDQPEERDLGDEVYEDVPESEDEAPLLREPPTFVGQSRAYDSRKRDPEHSNAENSCLWELIPFSAHFHPAVSVSAQHIIRHAKLPGNPDLELHTLIHFLDRFVYRNAKVGTSNLRGSSIMQPLAGGDTMGLLFSSASHGQVPLNSEKFWGKKSDDVPAEDVFFHQYFNSIGKTAPNKKTGKKKMRNNAEEDTSEDEESDVWKAMVESAPDLEGADDSDEDLEMSDLDSAFEGSFDERLNDEKNKVELEASLSDSDSSPDLDVSLASGIAGSASGGDEGMGLTSKKNGGGAGARRQKLKHLPTFASANGYAKMIDDEKGEDLG